MEDLITRPLRDRYKGYPEKYPDFEGFYGVRVSHKDGARTETVWYYTEETARHNASKISKRRNVLSCTLLVRRSDGTIGKLPAKKRKLGFIDSVIERSSLLFSSK